MRDPLMIFSSLETFILFSMPCTEKNQSHFLNEMLYCTYECVSACVYYTRPASQIQNDFYDISQQMCEIMAEQNGLTLDISYLNLDMEQSKRFGGC